jgi:hypothetical protein
MTVNAEIVGHHRDHALVVGELVRISAGAPRHAHDKRNVGGEGERGPQE